MAEDKELPDTAAFSCKDDGYGMTKISFGTRQQRYGWEISNFFNKVYPGVKARDGDGFQCPQY